MMKLFYFLVYSAYVFLVHIFFPEYSHAQGQEYMIVANKGVEITSTKVIAAIEIRNLYLKESNQWRDGTISKPFARSPLSPSQVAFEKHILKMTETELKTHWLKLKQIRGETAPRTISSISILLRQLERKKGAFAVMQSEEYIPHEQTKIIYRFHAE